MISERNVQYLSPWIITDTSKFIYDVCTTTMAFRKELGKELGKDYAHIQIFRSIHGTFYRSIGHRGPRHTTLQEAMDSADEFLLGYPYAEYMLLTQEKFDRLELLL